MNHKTEINQAVKDELQDAIRSKLFILPAFRLEGKQIEFLKTYALRLLSKEIYKIDLNKNSQFIFSNTLEQSSQSPQVPIELFNFQGFFKKIELLYSMISRPTWIKLSISILSVLASSWLIRQANIWVKLAGLLFMLVFPFPLLLFYKEVTLLNALINNTFDFIHRIQTEIHFYVDNIFSIHKQEEKEFRNSIEILTNKVTKEFIHEEIRQLDYNSKKIHLFSLIFAFGISFIVIYVTGDQFVILIKDIAKLMNLLKFFPIIINLDVQTFWLIFLFPLSIAWSRDIVVESSKKYSKKLHQSLFFIELCEDD